MKYNTLGHTGILVSELCLGTMTFATGEGMWKPVAGVEQKLADELLKLSFDAGINFVDTADVYTNGGRRRSSARRLRTSALLEKTSSSPPKSMDGLVPGATTLAPPAVTSWMPWRHR
ncbi:Oxidoreductase [Acidisarcina polymorpha]|uniref:Oxidoreductase n=1 Tax=Acidisarcina polymorpha TaxID=2211140 RepID=A0A2Z5FXL2_9BACT|nr:aldo/keto reductase [Acidisarcina polymorpha]AXC11244.1 Oxidoreductase [Acidisarcina polymorpha]